MAENFKVIDKGRVEAELPLFNGKPGLNADLDVLTDNSGGVDPGDDIIAAITAGVAIDPSNMDDGSANNVLLAIGDTSMGNESGNIEANFDKISDEVNTLLTGQVAIKAAIAQLAAKVNKVVAGRNPVLEVYGTNMTSALATYDKNGGLKLTTAGANNDQAALQAHANSGVSPFAVAGFLGSENSPRFECRIKTGSAVTAQKIFMGLSLTSALDGTTDDDGIKIVYTTASTHGQWEVWWSIAGTDYTYTVPTSVVAAVAADTHYRLKLEVYADLTWMAFINDKPVRNRNFPAITTAKDLVPFVGIQALTGAAKHMYVIENPRVSRLAGAA